jgi:hypothetical protein
MLRRASKRHPRKSNGTADVIPIEIRNGAVHRAA